VSQQAQVASPASQAPSGRQGRASKGEKPAGRAAHTVGSGALQTNAGQAKKGGFVVPQVFTEGFFVNYVSLSCEKAQKKNGI
jgi:hypothetical protein